MIFYGEPDRIQAAELSKRELRIGLIISTLLGFVGCLAIIAGLSAVHHG